MSGFLMGLLIGCIIGSLLGFFACGLFASKRIRELEVIGYAKEETGGHEGETGDKETER